MQMSDRCFVVTKFMNEQIQSKWINKSALLTALVSRDVQNGIVWTHVLSLDRVDWHIDRGTVLYGRHNTGDLSSNPGLRTLYTLDKGVVTRTTHAGDGEGKIPCRLKT